MAAVYRVWASLVALAIVVQIGLAGVGAFHAVTRAEDHKATKKTVENGFAPHAVFGLVVGILILALLIVAFLSRDAADDGRVKWSAILFGLFVLQIVLGGVGTAASGWLGILHAINAVVMAGIAGTHTGRVWGAHRGVSGAVPAPIAAAP